MRQIEDNEVQSRSVLILQSTQQYLIPVDTVESTVDGGETIVPHKWESKYKI